VPSSVLRVFFPSSKNLHCELRFITVNQLCAVLAQPDAILN
jgi:hypothetical protein